MKAPGCADQWLRTLALPAIWIVNGQNLHQRWDARLQLEAVYPLLLATARHLQAKAALAAGRPVESIRADLDKAYAAKVAHDRRHLARRWAELMNEAKPRAAQLQTLIPLFDRMAAGTADTAARREWWQRYGEVLSIFPVICSTNLSLAGAAPNERERFDLVILDEASQSDIASFLPALYRARRACVVGDDRQLTHISNLGADTDDRLMAAAGISAADTLSYHRHSAFDRARAVAEQVTLLDRHYRCVPEIIAFCNEHFYGGQLKVERPAEDGEALAGDLPQYGFRFDEIAAGETRYRSTSASKSALNTQEAQRVIGLVRQYIRAGVTDIGVVTPFRAQRALLQQLLYGVARTEADPAVRAAMKQVEIGTIHTSLGGQHQVMLFSTAVAQGACPGTVR